MIDYFFPVLLENFHSAAQPPSAVQNLAKGLFFLPQGFSPLALLIHEAGYFLLGESASESVSHIWFYNAMDYSLPGSSVLGILQARILEWVAIFFSKESSLLRDWTWVSCIAGRFFTIWVTREKAGAVYLVLRFDEQIPALYSLDAFPQSWQQKMSPDIAESLGSWGGMEGWSLFKLRTTALLTS